MNFQVLQFEQASKEEALFQRNGLTVSVVVISTLPSTSCDVVKTPSKKMVIWTSFLWQTEVAKKCVAA